jgi:hypothetical protein
VADVANLTQERWQKLLDQVFPDGAVASWPHDDNAPGYPVIYMVPWLEVTGTAGLDPIVVMRPFGVDRVVGPFRMIGHEVLRTKPHILWAVTFQGVPNNPMIWCAAMGDSYAEQIAAERARQQADPFPDTSYWSQPQAVAL